MKALFIFIFFNVQFCVSQNLVRDTLYVKFEPDLSEMDFGTRPSSSNNLEEKSYFYSIKNKYSILLMHYRQSQETIDYFNNGFVNPLKKEVDTSSLTQKKILDIQFFRKKSYEEVEETFNGMDFRSADDDAFIWLYNVDEINDGKVLLREVWFWPHQNE